jgi:hypothetical protein
LFSPFWSYPTPGTMIWTNLNLHYVRMLSCRFEIFWACGSSEDFWMTLPYFCIFVIVSPLNRTCPFIWTILNSLHLRMICTKFHWNWPVGSGEEHFFFKNQCIFTLLLLSFIWTISNPLYLRMISANFGYNWPSGSGEVENLNVYRRTDGQRAIRKAHFSIQLRWATNMI